MKAIRYHRYGGPDVLSLEDVDKPVPAAGEVLIAVRAAALNPLDSHLMRGWPVIGRLAFGLRAPKNPRVGVDMAGVVEAVGSGVTKFKPGDEVFGSARGACAGYTCAAETRLTVKPASVTFEQAACVPVAGLTALQLLRDVAHLQPGQKVLVNGAAGGVGTFTVQIAKALGAHVTGVCSRGNVELLRSLGADEAIDYTRADFAQGAARYDVLADCVGNRTLADCRRVLTLKGVLIFVGAHGGSMFALLGRMLGAFVLSRFVSQRLTIVQAKVRPADLAELADMMSSGKLRPSIDSRYTLATAAEAMSRLETWHARGKVVVTIHGEEQRQAVGR